MQRYLYFIIFAHESPLENRRELEKSPLENRRKVLKSPLKNSLESL